MIDPISRQVRQARKERLVFPGDEARQVWSPLLLEAAAIVDAGVGEGVRRADVLTPFREHADAAFDALLPFYGVAKSAERMQLFDNRRPPE